MVTTSDPVYTVLQQINNSISVFFVVTTFYNHHIVCATMVLFYVSIIANGLSVNFQSFQHGQMLFVTYRVSSCFVASFTSVIFEYNLHITIAKLVFEQEPAFYWNLTGWNR